MLNKFIYSFFVLFCATTAVVASGKCHKVCQDDYSHRLCFDNGKKIAALTIYLNVQEGKNCGYVAKYENGVIITQIGGLAPTSGITSLNLSGEQIVTMYNCAGEVCFTSTSKNWDIEGKNIVHHHDGFDVYTNKKTQFVIAH